MSDNMETKHSPAYMQIPPRVKVEAEGTIEARKDYAIDFDSPLPGIRTELLDGVAKSSKSGAPMDADTAFDVMALTAMIVSNGRSVAVASQFKLAANNTADHRKVALSRLSPVQKCLYDEWEQGRVILPSINWDIYKAGCDHSTKMVSRSRAMAKVWGVDTDRVQPENYMRLAKENSMWVNLVVAVDKFNVAKREVTGGQEKLSGLEMAEYQTLRAISKACNKAFTCSSKYDSLTIELRAGPDRQVISKRLTWLKDKLVSN